MKADKPDKKLPIELTGKVVQKLFAKGSKSEHTAIYLETDQGAYKLRRLGANAFSDPELKKLIGKKIRATGTLNDYLFIARELKTGKDL